MIRRRCAKCRQPAAKVALIFCSGWSGSRAQWRCQDFASFADQQDLARVSWVGIKARTAPEIVVERRPVKIRCGGVLVDLPPGGFAQASDSGHAALERGVMEALGPIARLAGRIADLYSGAGTFTFPMVEAGARVHAVEGDGVALDALGRAANAHNLADAVTMERRDLARWPLTAEELSAFDGIVFDPPRGGAKAQAAEIGAIVGAGGGGCLMQSGDICARCASARRWRLSA